MKNLIMIVVAFATMQASAQDQIKDLNPQRVDYKSVSTQDKAQFQTEKLTSALMLTEEQQKKIHALLLERAELQQTKRGAHKEAKETSKAHSTAKADRLKWKNERMSHQAEFENNMKIILSSEQLSKYEALTAERTQRRKSAMRQYKARKQ